MDTKKHKIPALRVKFIEAADQRRLALNTRKAYARWIKKFIRFHHPRKPIELGANEVALFLTFLVTKQGVSASTQHLAFNAVVFLFRYVLKKDIGRLPHIPRALRRGLRNSALTRAEFQVLLSHIPKNFKLVFLVMYGCGLRISEVVSLTMKDILWEEDLLVLRNTKARNNRVVRVPTLLKEKLSEQVRLRRQWHLKLEMKRHPAKSMVEIQNFIDTYWNDEYIFVSNRARFEQQSDMVRMRALSPSFLQRIFKAARKNAKLGKAVTPHSLRYSFATEAVVSGNNIAELQLTLGHKDPNTTARYIDVSRTIRQVASPLDTFDIATIKDESPSVPTKVESLPVKTVPSFLKSILQSLTQIISWVREKSLIG